MKRFSVICSNGNSIFFYFLSFLMIISFINTDVFGNPFFLDTDGDRDQVCDGYIEYFKHKRSLHEKVKELKGKALGCHCAPLRCHGDHLKSLADEN